ncbi:MAG: universal stress protein, partial [Thermoanaerobaculia bacterium]
MRKSDWQIAEIIAATDLSDCARNALDHAIALSRATGARLTVVHARANAPDYEDLYRSRASAADSRSPRYADLYADGSEPVVGLALDDEAAAALARTHRDQLENLSRVRELGVAGEPVQAILDVTERAGAAIIVVGSHARPAVAGALLGSTADAVIRRSTVPVLAVPCDARRDAGGT